MMTNRSGLALCSRLKGGDDCLEGVREKRVVFADSTLRSAARPGCVVCRGLYVSMSRTLCVCLTPKATSRVPAPQPNCSLIHHLHRPYECDGNRMGACRASSYVCAPLYMCVPPTRCNALGDKLQQTATHWGTGRQKRKG